MLGVVLLGEKLSLPAGIGILFIFSGLAILSFRGRPNHSDQRIVEY
jgi:drug/metabolite transporter (DMT)-like permease